MSIHQCECWVCILLVLKLHLMKTSIKIIPKRDEDEDENWTIGCRIDSDRKRVLAAAKNRNKKITFFPFRWQIYTQNRVKFGVAMFILRLQFDLHQLNRKERRFSCSMIRSFRCTQIHFLCAVHFSDRVLCSFRRRRRRRCIFVCFVFIGLSLFICLGVWVSFVFTICHWCIDALMLCGATLMMHSTTHTIETRRTGEWKRFFFLREWKRN